MKKKVVVAYSGGLDTTYCVKYLSEVLGYEIHSVIVNTGGFSDQELVQIETRAKEIGTHTHKSIDVTGEFYQKCIKYLLFGNVLKYNTYPLSVSAERMFQAIAIANYANDIDADAIAHGSTGAGNDQVRFDLAFSVICPDKEIITPIRDKALSRQEEIDFLKEHGIIIDFEKAKYSINKGIWGTSVGGAETLTSHLNLPEEAWPTPLTKTEPTTLKIGFEKGEPISVNDTKMASVDAIIELNTILGEYAIGRDTHIGDTILGIKGRVGFEAPAPTVLIKAHHLLEKHTLSKWQLMHKDQLANWYGTLLHEALYLDPFMRDVEKFLESSQDKVTGTVHLELHPHRFVLVGVDSPYDILQSKAGTYGEENLAWSSDDAKGFIKLYSNQLRILNSIKDNNE